MFRRFKYADNAVIVGIVEFRQESGFGQLFQPLCASSKGNPKAWAHVCRVGARRWWCPCSRGMQCHHGSGRMCRGACCAKLGLCIRREPVALPVLEECLVLCTTGAAADNSPEKVGSPRWRGVVHLQ
ncbi:uncharacterized protein LOC144143463 isoform X1 [Haemaphysalis longicornis]